MRPLAAAIALFLAADAPPEAGPDGRAIFERSCAICHGAQGHGDGPASGWLSPRPRDLGRGPFRLRSTATGTPPTDADLERTFVRGIAGSAMPGFAGFTPAERAALVAFLKTLLPSGDAPEPVVLPEPPLELDVARGAALYLALGCGDCHGPGGAGDGPSARTLKDDLGRPAPPGDLRRSRRFKAGRAPGDLVRTFLTGMDGTPMPSYLESIAPEDAWHLAGFVVSLANDR